MIAIDTNILFYAHREESSWHATAFARLAGLAEDALSGPLPAPCVAEFLAIATPSAHFRSTDAARNVSTTFPHCSNRRRSRCSPKATATGSR
jgi:predicted nucleic acid-binding protein